MQLMWGVIPIVVAAFHTTDEMIQRMVNAANQREHANVGDNIVLDGRHPA